MSDALTLGGVDMTQRHAARALPPESHRPKMLSQWFTPEELAERLAAWVGWMPTHATVLEPSAGDGALARAALDALPMPRITACEIDETYHRQLYALRSDGHVTVEIGDYLRRAAPVELYDLALMNPPYEDGMDGAFIAKAMAESRMVVGLCRLNVFVSKTRYESVWSKIGAGWDVAGIAFLVSRPSFLLAGRETDSPLSDFAAFKLVRSGATTAPTCVEWWT